MCVYVCVWPCMYCIVCTRIIFFIVLIGCVICASSTGVLSQRRVDCWRCSFRGACALVVDVSTGARYCQRCAVLGCFTRSGSSRRPSKGYSPCGCRRTPQIPSLCLLSRVCCSSNGSNWNMKCAFMKHRLEALHGIGYFCR